MNQKRCKSNDLKSYKHFYEQIFYKIKIKRKKFIVAIDNKFDLFGESE